MNKSPTLTEKQSDEENMNSHTEPFLDDSDGLNFVKSVDFETAIGKAGFGKFNYFILLIAIPASCTSTFVVGAMSYVIPVAGSELELTPMRKALLQSAPYAGMISSAFVWGAMSDSFGRKNLLAIGYILDFIMNTLCAAIPHWIPILIFKFLSGSMVSGPFSIFVAYLSEVFILKKRDLAVLSIGIFSGALQCLHVGLAFLVIPAKFPDWLPLKSWQLFIFFCGFPSLITGISCAFCVESPKFLTEKGKPEKALDVCKTIYAINTGRSRNSYPVKKIRKPAEIMGNNEENSVLNKIMATTSVLKAPYVNRLLMMFVMQGAAVVTANLIVLWLPEMLTVVANADPEIANKTNTLCPLLVSGQQRAATSRERESSRESVYYEMFILQAINFCSQIVFVIVVKYVTKKLIILVVSTVAVCCVITIPFIDGKYIFIPSAVTAAIQGIVFMALLGLLVEIFPTSVRATSVSVVMMSGRIGVLVANFLMANLMYSYCEYIFYFIATLCLSIIVVCSFLNTAPIEAPSNEGTKQQA